MTFTPGDSGEQVLTPKVTFKPGSQWQGSVQVAPVGAVLGEEPPGSAAVSLLSLFEPEGAPVELEVEVAPSAVLGEEEAPQGELVFHPDEEAAYALLQLVETADGVIYDVTLPAAADAGGAVLGEPGGTLRFPVNSLIPPADAAGPAVLGIETAIGNILGNAIGKRVLQVIKTPVTKLLLQGVRQAEGEPTVVALRDAGDPKERLQPLQGAESWRALLPPGDERRVLLFIHGFGSSTQGSGGGVFLPELAAGYDAVLGFNHPTLSADPEENARAFLAHVPEDLRLSVDIIAHSRGGLVARSLVELVAPLDRFAPRRLVTFGSPHGGTELANPQKWDRLISISLTAVSWLAMLAGAATPIPKLVEWVLKAAAQSFFDLPGVAAMRPMALGDNAFLNRLNAPADPASGAGTRQGQVRYGAAVSNFSIFNVEQPSFRQAFKAMTAQAFFGNPHDLVVPTASMSAIDAAQAAFPADRTFKAGCDHFSYFVDERVREFLRSELAA